MTAWMNTIHCQWLCTLCLLLIALFIFFFADSKNFIYEDGAYKTTDWMNYVRCQWFPIFCLLLIALLIFLCLFFAYCLCCFTHVYCSQSRDIASAKIRILQILWQWIVMALVVYLLTYLCIRSWVLRTYCYVIRLSALYTCFIIQYTSYDSWPCSDWPPVLATTRTDSCP